MFTLFCSSPSEKIISIYIQREQGGNLEPFTIDFRDNRKILRIIDESAQRNELQNLRKIVLCPFLENANVHLYRKSTEDAFLVYNFEPSLLEHTAELQDKAILLKIITGIVQRPFKPNTLLVIKGFKDEDQAEHRSKIAEITASPAFAGWTVIQYIKNKKEYLLMTDHNQILIDKELSISQANINKVLL